jgi:hypothetical protein
MNISKKEEQERLDLGSRIFKRIEMIFGEEKAYKWMNTENPYLGNSIPIVLIAIGRGHKVEQFVNAALGENKNE